MVAMVLPLFITFGLLFIALTVGSIILVVRLFRSENRVGYWLAVPAIFVTLIFLYFTIYFVRRVGLLV